MAFNWGVTGDAMTDFSHWEFAEQFDGYDAAALILGMEPRESEGDQWRIQVITDRMEMHYQSAVEKARRTATEAPWKIKSMSASLTEQDLPSTQLSALWSEVVEPDGEIPFVEWLSGRGSSKFDFQKFSREQIANWLDVIGMQSKYEFRRGGTTSPAREAIAIEIDPADLPIELDAANLAFRAVMNGYGDPSKTPRNRLIDYIEENFPDFKSEQVQRIATVANPDKTTGRKRSSKE
jgi:hypothetical protein